MTAMISVRKIFTKTGKTINWFIPPNIQAQKELHHKARILVAIHLFMLCASAIMVGIALFMPVGSAIPTYVGVVGISVSLFVFRKWGNFSLSGNMLTLIPILGLTPIVPSSGGMYSDNLLWLYLCPLIAFLFTSKRWRIFWVLIVVAFHVYLFILELNAEVSFRQYLFHDPYYYFNSYLLLFVVMLGVVYIFRVGQDSSIEELQKQRNLLLKQKEEIQQQTNKLKLQEQKLKEMNKGLEQFAYVASHDLKEPLRTIGSFIELIEKELQKNGNTHTNEYINFVTDGVDRMNAMISNLLNNIQNTKKDHSEVDLNNVILLVMNNLSASVKERGAKISYDNLPSVEGSSTTYIQLFQNLISNSLKFQKTDVPPHIRIINTGVNGHHHIKVSDNGMGIPKDYLPNVFDLYNRGEIKESHSGHGIGLSTCKEIVHRYGGDISVDSTVNKGTVFTIKLPKARVVDS